MDKLKVWFRGKPEDKQAHYADASLVFITIIWGYTFVAVKDALAGIEPFWFNSLRFWIAFLFLSLCYRKRLQENWRGVIGAANLIGAFLFIGYAFQTVGLKYTTASNSGFITGLAVVMTPFIGVFWGQKMPRWGTWLGIVSATLGLGLLSLNDGFAFNKGDTLTLISAFAFSFQIVAVSVYAPKKDAVSLTICQIGVVAVWATFFAVCFEQLPITFSAKVWEGLAVTAIPATALTFLVQNVSQKYTSPVRTALIFALEPVFAGLFAWWVFGESLNAQQWMGCGMIVAGMVISEIKG